MKTRSARSIDILTALDDPKLFGGQFQGSSWLAWRAFLACLFGLSMTEEIGVIAKRCTGRNVLPEAQAREAALVIGRRGGKSRIAALIGVFLACFRDYSKVLSEGEKGVVMLIASDRRQARVLKRYVSGMLQAVPMLAQMVENETVEGITLSNQVVIEIHTASFKAVRGYTVVAVVLDEIAFWPSDDAANADSEVLNALRPAMATVPDALLLMISSPYARRGELWRAYKAHFGQDHSPVLIWQADTKTMNPLVPQSVIDAAYEADEAVASAEYGAQFRKDLEAFVRMELVEACTVPGRYELPPIPDVWYCGFVDPSGGGRDSMTLAIAHWEDETAVLDLMREVTPPFSPEMVTTEFSDTLRRYGLAEVTGDRYGGEWPREQFQKRGIDYLVSDLTRSDVYREMLPLLNSRTVALLDLPRLRAQLLGLERRTARGGKETIDHGPNQHDDVINAAAGALVLTSRRAMRPRLALIDTGFRGYSLAEIEKMEAEDKAERLRQSAADIAESLANNRYFWPGD